MKTIRTIDLWTQVELQDPNFECFNGAFIDGIDKDIPFDLIKIYKNCNCNIMVKDNIVDIQNKHTAIVFLKEENPNYNISLFNINVFWYTIYR